MLFISFHLPWDLEDRQRHLNYSQIRGRSKRMSVSKAFSSLQRRFPFLLGGWGGGARPLRHRIEAEIVISGHGPQQLGFVPWRHHFPLFLLPGVSMRASLQYSWRFSAHALRHRILKDMNSAATDPNSWVSCHGHVICHSFILPEACGRMTETETSG